MNENKRRDRDLQVLLIGVPHFHQGDADQLCYFYSMSMLLGALRPELLPDLLDRPLRRRKGSPILHALKQLSKDEGGLGIDLEGWFYRGVSHAQALKVLNTAVEHVDSTGERAFGKRRVFARRPKGTSSRVATVGFVLKLLDKQLPFVVCGGGLENHSAVAVGYSREPSGRWLQLLDPTAVGPRWEHATDLFDGGASVILPRATYFEDHRPHKVVIDSGEARLEKWDSWACALQ